MSEKRCKSANCWCLSVDCLFRQKCFYAVDVYYSATFCIVGKKYKAYQDLNTIISKQHSKSLPISHSNFIISETERIVSIPLALALTW